MTKKLQASVVILLRDDGTFLCVTKDFDDIVSLNMVNPVTGESSDLVAGRDCSLDLDITLKPWVDDGFVRVSDCALKQCIERLYDTSGRVTVN